MEHACIQLAGSPAPQPAKMIPKFPATSDQDAPVEVPASAQQTTEPHDYSSGLLAAQPMCMTPPSQDCPGQSGTYTLPVTSTHHLPAWLASYGLPSEELVTGKAKNPCVHVLLCLSGHTFLCAHSLHSEVRTRTHTGTHTRAHAESIDDAIMASGEQCAHARTHTVTHTQSRTQSHTVTHTHTHTQPHAHTNRASRR